MPKAAAALWQKYFSNAAKLEKKFVEAGGLLMGGSDTTGYGGVIPGYSAKREIELLVQADGFTFPQATRIVSLNAAKFEGRDKDIVVIDGDPMENVSAIEHIPLVFKNGVSYDTAAIFKPMQGQIGMK